MAIPLPPITVPMVDGNGNITLEWLRYFQSRETVGLSNLPDVKLATLSNNQVLIWKSADSKWENGSN